MSSVAKVFITKNKIDRIIQKLNINNSSLSQNISATKTLKWVLSIPERKYLAAYAAIINNPEEVLNEAYKSKEVRKDDYKYVYFSDVDSYHFSENCEFLNSDYTNFTIPVEVEHAGKQAIERYREFFKNNQRVYGDNYEAFLAQAGMYCKVKIRNPSKKVELVNSGLEEFLDMSLEQIDVETEKLLKKMDLFKNSCEEAKKEISRYGFASHKASREDEKGDWKKIIDDENSYLYQWHQYKSELKLLIREYFRIKLNPEFSFKESILEQLKFKPCSCCADKLSNERHFNVRSNSTT